MRSTHLTGLVSLAIVASAPTYSQEPGDPAVALEEIIVTAAKREQSLKEVPISVSVTIPETIEKAQIRDLNDLQTVVPSLKVRQLNAVGQTNFVIRGFGNGAGNDGIESSVGVFVDGVYRSRTSSALDDLPEIERIEVLRGPQSTLFGKNVSAGAISIVTAKPQKSFGALTELGFGDNNSMYAKASVTGPLGESFAYRLSGNVNQRDGYMKNVTTGNDINNRDRWSVRADMLWTPSEAVSVRVIGDYNEIKEACCGVVSLLNGPATQFIGAALGPVGDPANKFDRDIIFNTDPTNRLTGKGGSVQVDWDAGPATLTSITAYRVQTNESTQDVDFTGADLANKNQPNEIKTFTQELRLASNGEDRINWLAGAFFQDESLDSGVTTLYGSQMRAYANGLSGGAITTLEGAQRAAGNTAVVPGATYFQAGQGISDFYKMDQTFYSVYGQVDFKVTEKLTLTGGVAYLDDRKEATSNVVLMDPFSALNLQNIPELANIGVPVNAFAPLGGLQFFYGDTPNHGPVNYPNANESGVLEGDQVTYALRAAYDFGAFNAYVSYSTGWKAGAYNLSSDSRPPDVNGVGRSAGPEEVTVYEVGLKASFDTGYLNLAVFDQSIEGFQSNAYTGTGYSLVNAGEQSVRGFELDTYLVPLDWLTLTAAATYLDPEYDSFTGAPCVSYDTVRCPIDPATGRRPPFRDLTGETPAGIPEWSFSTSAMVSKSFGQGFGVYFRAEYDYSSDTQTNETTPPETSTWGESTVNASIGLTNEPHQYEVMLWARNLTDDDRIFTTFPTVAQEGSYSGFPNQPRSYGLTLRKRF